MAWYGVIRYSNGMVPHGTVWCGVVWCGVVWCGLVWYGEVWYGMVWYGMVWYGMVLYLIVRYSASKEKRIDKATYNTKNLSPPNTDACFPFLVIY